MKKPLLRLPSVQHGAARESLLCAASTQTLLLSNTRELLLSRPSIINPGAYPRLAPWWILTQGLSILHQGEGTSNPDRHRSAIRSE